MAAGDSPGFIRRWVLVGPFDRTATAAPVSPGAEQPPGEIVDAAESGHVWRRDFDGRLGYAYTDIDVAEAGPLVVYLGANGRPSLWLDGRAIVDAPAQGRRDERWQYGRRVTLARGRHRLLLALDNDVARWGFQLEMYTDGDHARIAPTVPTQLAIDATPASAFRLTATVTPRPAPLGLAVPVQVTVDGPGGASTAQGRSGAPIALPPRSARGVVHVAAVATLPGGRRLQATVPAYVGDFGADRARLAASFAAARAARAAYSDWQAVQAAFDEWATRWLETPIATPDAADLENFTYVEGLADAPAARFVAEHPRAALPLRFDGGEYAVELPPGWTPGPPRPLLIALHGSGGVGQKVVYRSRPGTGAPELVRVYPRCPAGQRWDPAFLEAMLASVRGRFAIDADRIYLTGFSLGGMGTWSWALAHPERFAAIAPKAGGGEPFRAARLTRVPAWIFQGGRDATVPPYRAELMLSALHAAGAVARYTLAPDAGHDEGAFETAPLEDWLLRHRRDPGPAPPDPGADAALDPAVAPVRFDTAPAGFDLIAPDGPTWTARLYDAVRATGHPASAPVQRRRRAPNGPVEQLLPSPFPVEPTSPALLLARSPAFRYVSVVVRGGAAAMAVARRRATAAVARAGRVATGEEREIALGGRGDASITELRIGIR